MAAAGCNAVLAVGGKDEHDVAKLTASLEQVWATFSRVCGTMHVRWSSFARKAEDFVA